MNIPHIAKILKKSPKVEGNTTPSTVKIPSNHTYEHYCFTLFGDFINTADVKSWINCTDAKLNRFISFIVFQQEKCPKTGKLHIQGYLQLKTPKTLQSMKKIDERAHWEYTRGSSEQAAEYCMKEESRVAGPFEIGKYRDIEALKQGQRNDLTKVVESIAKAKTAYDVYVEHPEMFLKFGNNISKAISLKFNKIRENAPKVILVKGPSGSGKSHYIHNKHGYDNVYSLSKSMKSWDGYWQQDAIIFDEIKFNQYPREYWLKLFDCYPMRDDCKYGTVQINSPYIYLVNSVDEELNKFYEDFDMYRRITSEIWLVNCPCDNESNHYIPEFHNKPMFNKEKNKPLIYNNDSDSDDEYEEVSVESTFDENDYCEMLEATLKIDPEQKIN